MRGKDAVAQGAGEVPGWCRSLQPSSTSRAPCPHQPPPVELLGGGGSLTPNHPRGPWAANFMLVNLAWFPHVKIESSEHHQEQQVKEQLGDFPLWRNGNKSN